MKTRYFCDALKTGTKLNRLIFSGLEHLTV